MRYNLPFREKTELFLINESWRIIAQDHWTYLMFPGGWIDSIDQSRSKSAIRELTEETGLEIIWELFPFTTVSWCWFPEWANTPKRKERYLEFQGEQVHIFIWRAKVQYGNNPLSNHDDKWNNITGMDPDECLETFVRYCLNDHPNTYAYRVAQYAAIRSTYMLSSIIIDIPTVELRTNA